MPRMTAFLIVIVFALGGSILAGERDGRIYGKIATIDGDVYEGLIRWDKNEANWVDVLDGSKDIPKSTQRKSKRRRHRNRETSIEIFGIKIGEGSNTSWSWSSSAQSGIRFGHIRTLEVIDDDKVLLVLKSGKEIELENGSTDIGSSIREILIEDKNEGEIELVWDDLESIDFMPAGSGMESNLGTRLYGTLTTRRGDKYTGYVCWDVDELFTKDILDGEDRNRDRKIKFGKIASIERYSSSGATITLTNGDEMILKGSNDVDDDNRGITISDPGFGQVIVDWDEFDRLDFTEASRQVGYDEFDGGQRLHGTVFTEEGESFTGDIRWDNDEEYTWEILDGEYHDIEFDIEFSLIAKIEKRSRRSTLIT
ncbi:MAG: hypothetical protein DRP47_00385, partial [Candidatus Zixiibacteriota bacterium]